MNKFYTILVNLTLRRRRLLVGLIIGVTLVLGFFAARIEIKTNFKDLLSASAPVMRAYDQMRENYPYSSSVFVVLEGKDTSKLTAVGDALAVRLQADKEWVHDVQWREDMDFFRKHSLILQKTEDLEKTEKDLADHPKLFEQMFVGFNLADFLAGTNAAFSDYDTQSSVKQDEGELVRDMGYYQGLFAAIEAGVSGNVSAFAIDRSLTDLMTDPKADSMYRYIDDEGRIISPDGTVALMQVVPQGDGNDATYALQLTAYLRKVAAEFEAMNPGVKIGLTGMPVIASDETDAVTHHLMLGFLVALIGILLIFFIGFRRIFFPVLATIPLVIGAVWSMGIASISIGELNLFSMMAPIILLGLGIDYAIHIIAKYTESRAAGMTIAEAMTGVFDRIGRGLTVGALTTAAAFFAITVAGFKGMNDFGIVGGISVLGAFLAMVMIFPLLLTTFDRRLGRKGKAFTEVPFQFLGRATDRFIRTRYLILAGLVVLTVLGAFSVSRLQTEKDILKIEPEGLASIRLQHLILDKFNFSIYTSYAMFNSLDDIYRATQELETKPTVKRTESVADVFPSPEQQAIRRGMIMKIAPYIEALSPSASKSVSEEEILAQLSELKSNLFQLKTLSYMAGLTRLVGAIEDAEGKLGAVVNSVQAASDEALRAVNDIVYTKLKLEYDSLVNGTQNLVITRADVPPVYFDRFEGKDGSFLLTVYPSEYVWEAKFTARHLAELRSVLAEPTGMIPIWGQVLAKMMPGMLRATGAVLGVLTILLLIDFRKARRAVTILIPLVLSLFFTLALMSVLGMKLNIVNMMAFPLILGIGIDDAVHLYHRYLVERNIRRTFISTGKAVMMTTLTTIMAMMSLVLSSHPGMISFAWVASMGIALCLVLDLLILPVLINLFEKEGKEK